MLKQTLKNMQDSFHSFSISYFLFLPWFGGNNFHTFNKQIDGNSFAEGKSDKEILDHLLKNSRYDKRLLPPVDGNVQCFQSASAITFVLSFTLSSNCLFVLSVVCTLKPV